jgi:CheY-like chemotaxis protein
LFRVLIIEDDRFNRRLYEDLLTADGIEVETLPNALDGLRRAGEAHFDLVVMDIELPDLDGLEATRMLKSNPRTAGLPVVIISAHALREHEQQALEVGDAFLRKPLRFPEFQETIRRFAAGRA